MGRTERKITHASLFSGIGGAEYAATLMGWENLFHCEINPFGRKVLDYWYPNSQSYEDITKTDFTAFRGRVDVLTGGFPCQPFSLAGKRGGADDDRYLWPQMLRAIREIRPAWIVGENVAGILTIVEQGSEVEMGRSPDFLEEGRIYRKESTFTIERICQDIEQEGYSVQPIVIPACSVGAPHRRDRVWIVARRDGVAAHADGTRLERPQQVGTGWQDSTGKWCEMGTYITGVVGKRHSPDPNGELHEARDGQTNEKRQTKIGTEPCYGQGGEEQLPFFRWAEFPTQPLFVCEMMGFPLDWLVSPFQSGGKNP